MRILPWLFCLLPLLLSAQRRPAYTPQRDNSGAVLLISPSYGAHSSGEDLAQRFGNKFSTGGSVDYMLASNFIIGTQSMLFFGSNVKTDVLASLRDSEGLIFGDGGGIAEVRLRERGFYLGGHVGKVFPLAFTKARSGLRVTFGGGFLQHKIRIQDDPQVYVSQLSGDYKKGYDRLSNGWAITQFTGYQYLSANRLINFHVGLEFTAGFTESRRSYNFDMRSAETDRRIDLYSGIRLAWTLPLYVGENADEIRY
jgi:hypothetical protein